MSALPAHHPSILRLFGCLVGASLPAPLWSIGAYADASLLAIAGLLGIPTGAVIGLVAAPYAVATHRPWRLAFILALLSPLVAVACLYTATFVFSGVGVSPTAGFDGLATLVAVIAVTLAPWVPVLLPVTLPFAIGAITLIRALAAMPLRQAMLVVAGLVGVGLVAGIGAWLESARPSAGA
jgi:hypothetical protein